MNVKYIATITNVKEIILKGTADAAYWREYLKPHNLFPFETDGKADIHIGTIESKFNGIKFREAVFSVAVSRSNDGTTHDGMFLLQGFTSLRLFAFFERFFFKTPYSHAKIVLDFPASLSVQKSNDKFFEATRNTQLSNATSSDESWEGAIFLPVERNSKPKLFYAKLCGQTLTIPFDSSKDLFKTNNRCLNESNFQPKEWKIREDATHSRSKTFPVTEQTD